MHAKRGGEAAAMAALNEAVEVATQRLGAASEAALSARAELSNTFSHFGHTGPALEAIEPALAPARAAFGALRPHPLLSIIECFHGDALARHHRPREAAIILRQVLAEQRALDVVETTRVRVTMTLLANALMLGGHFEEAQSLVAQSEALHERLTGGANDEGIAQASRHTLVCALRGDGQGALLNLGRLDALAAASGEAESLAIDRFPLRVLTLATAGRPAEALEHADAMDPHFATLTDTARVRTHRARALALRRTGSPESARRAIEAALAIAAEGGCIGLEHGLALAEAARCGQALGDTAEAAVLLQSALATWEAGQVDGAEVLQPVHVELALLQAAH